MKMYDEQDVRRLLDNQREEIMRSSRIQGVYQDAAGMRVMLRVDRIEATTDGIRIFVIGATQNASQSA